MKSKQLHISFQISDKTDMTVGISQDVTTEFIDGKWNCRNESGSYIWTGTGETQHMSVLRWLQARLGMANVQ